MIVCTWHVEFFDFHYIFICVLFIVLSRTHWCEARDTIGSYGIEMPGWLAGKCVFTLINLTLLLLWHVNMPMWSSVWFDKIFTIYGCREILYKFIWCDRHSLSIYSVDCMLLFIGKSAWRDHSQMLPLFRHTITHTLVSYNSYKHTPCSNQLTGWLTETAMHVFYHRLR